MPTSAEPPGQPVPGGLRVGQVPGVTVTKWQRIWSERFRRIRLELVEVRSADQVQALRSGHVDLCFVRLPLSSEGLHVIPLYEEVPVVVTPKDHPVAAFEAVTRADLAGEQLLDDDETGAAFDQVGWGHGLLLVPLSVARTQSRRDLIHRPVSDAEPTRVALAWLMDNPNELIDEFIGIVRGRTPNSSRTQQNRIARRAEPAPEKQPKRQGGQRRSGTGR